jgi:hypothetical protein
MDVSWLSKILVPLSIPLIMQLLRRLAPAPPPPPSTWKYDQPPQKPEPFATGIIGGFMWTVALLLALSFFAFRWVNHEWAQIDGPAVLRVYATSVIWCFFPGFAALAIPWPLTISLLRRLGRTDEADSITTESNRSGGMDSYRVMKWLCIGLVGPIAGFTILAIPIHLTITDSALFVGHYAQWQSERFDLSQARRVTLVDGVRYRDGSLHLQKDLYVDFADGRRLDANTAADGGTSVPDTVLKLLLEKTHLPVRHAQTKEDIPGL